MDIKSCGKKLSKSASGLRMIPVSDDYASPFALPEPMWIADNQVAVCHSCKQSFDFFKRKHHCRRCGRCFCDRCCHYSIPLKRMYFVDPVRHCYECAIISKAEEEFYEKSVTLLQSGVDVSVHDCISDLAQGRLKCFLSSDSRSILFQSLKSKSSENSATLPTLLLHKIHNAQFETDVPTENSSSLKLAKLIAVTISFKDENMAIQQLKLTPLEARSSVSWFRALQQATTMVNESNASGES